MAQKTRPRDDRESANLKSWESPATPVDAPASCPLLQTVTLLPLRYGRAETAPTGSAAGMPYTLKSRPMGYRMLRDGYIYIYDEDAGQLAEYEYRDNILGGGPMEYPRDHVLYVGFADIQWTAKKKAQITASEEERHHWMQRVNLGSASPLSGGEHLLTVEQAKQWVAEFAEDYQPEPIDDSYPEETTPYLWENQPYYHKSRVGKLLKQQNADDPDECLCLVLRDDVGVMLDLADHQDLVVGWLDRWANEGDNERNYVLGALIESMTLINTESLDAILESSRDPAIRAIRDDLEAMDPEARAETEEALLDILNQPDQGPYASPALNDPSLHPQLRADIMAELRTANPRNAHDIDVRKKRAVERWHIRQSLENADPGFVDRNLEGLQALTREQRTALKKVLEGQGFGHRGINRLIDRGAMDQVMKEHREKLARWQAQLDVITEDRVDMLCSERLHRATWYFDLDDTEQVEAALDLQYACLKDICRAETAAEEILAWLENNPQYTHPLFQALPLQDQAPEGELAKTYSTMASAGYSVVTRSASWIDQWRQAEAGKLPDLERLSERIQIKAEAIGDVLSPAVSMSMARSLQTLYDGIERQSLPALDELFRDLPLFFKKQMLKAIEAGEAEFRFASDGELASFREDVRQMLVLRERLSAIRHEYKIIKKNQGHKSAEAAAKRTEFRQVREDHRAIGTRVAGALSPVDETTSAIRLEDGAPGRAMLSVVAPAAAQEEVRRLTGQFRKGLATAPRVDLISDGLGWVVFAAQAVNLWQVMRDFNTETEDKAPLTAVLSSVIATLGAGFLASQSLMETAYGTRARVLAGAWQHSALKAVQIRMGILHVGLGFFAYGAGGISSAMAFVGYQSKWQESVRRGNAGAQVGAAMGMVGSGGLAVTQGYGLSRTVGMGYQAMRVQGEVAKATAWALAGTRLSMLFARLNLAGLVFTVFELAGTWVYNRFNLDKRDKWLLTVPWSTEPEYIHNGSLAEYEKALAGVSSSVDLLHQDGEKGRKQVILNCYALPNNVLEERLGAEPPTRVALAAWQVKPARNIRGYVTEETWVSCTDVLLPSLQLTEGEDHLQLTFTSPERKGFWFFMEAPYLALMVKVSTRISDDEHVEETYLLKLNSSSDKPVTPTEDSPKGDIQWRNVPDPLMSLENL